MVFPDLFTNCENELLKNESLFSDEALLTEIEEPVHMIEDFDFLNVESTRNLDESKPCASSAMPNVIKPSPEDNPQLPESFPVQLKQQRAPVTQTLFTPNYSVHHGINLSVSTPMVTLAPVPAQQSHLIFPSNLIKSESVLYSGGPQPVASTPVSHQLHTLVNTTNGTILTTGKGILKIFFFYFILTSLFSESMTNKYIKINLN